MRSLVASAREALTNYSSSEVRFSFLLGQQPPKYFPRQVKEEVLYLSDCLCHLGEEAIKSQKPAEAVEWFSESLSALEFLEGCQIAMVKTKAHVLCRISQAHLAISPAGDSLLRASNAINLSINEAPTPVAFVQKLQIMKALGVEKTSWNEGKSSFEIKGDPRRQLIYFFIYYRSLLPGNQDLLHSQL